MHRAKSWPRPSGRAGFSASALITSDHDEPRKSYGSQHGGYLNIYNIFGVFNIQRVILEKQGGHFYLRTPDAVSIYAV